MVLSFSHWITGVLRSSGTKYVLTVVFGAEKMFEDIFVLISAGGEWSEGLWTANVQSLI